MPSEAHLAEIDRFEKTFPPAPPAYPLVLAREAYLNRRRGEEGFNTGKPKVFIS